MEETKVIFDEARKSALPDVKQKIQEGRKNALQEEAKDIAQRSQHAQFKLDTLAQKTAHELFRADSVFPFDLFPDTLIIDSSKVTIITRSFLATETVTSIVLAEITDVVVDSAFFLAQMTIVFAHNPIHPVSAKMPALRKDDAFKAKQILQGILVLLKEDVDITTISADGITHKLQQIGKA